jgi:hypothetical protein
MKFPRELVVKKKAKKPDRHDKEQSIIIQEEGGVRMFSPQACEMYTLGLSCRKGKSVLQSPA